MDAHDRTDSCTCGSGKKPGHCCQPYSARVSKDNIATVIQAALEHHRNGRLAQAKIFYQQILLAEPDNPDALHYLGAIASGEGRYLQAVELIGRAASIRPSRSIHYNLGNAHKALGGLGEAAENYRRALAFDPDFADAHANLGNVLKAQGRLDEAAESYQKALSLKPGIAEIRRSLDSVIREQKKHRIADILKKISTDLDSRNLARAEIFCRDVLDIQPDNPDALNALGLISLKVGMPDFAGEYLSHAATSSHPSLLNIDVAAIRKQLENMRSIHADANKAAGERFALIKAWGFGFWSDVDHTLGGLLLAEIAGRTPVVHWGANSLFSDDPDSNTFETFFEPVSSVQMEDLLNDDLGYFPPKWSAHNLRSGEVNKWKGEHSKMGALFLLRRPERVVVSDFYNSVISLMPWIKPGHPAYGLSVDEVYCYLVNKYLKPRNTIVARIEEFYSQHLADAPYIAVHARGSDKQLEIPQLDEINHRYFDRIDAMLSNKPYKVFLLSDSIAIIEHFRQRFGNRLVTTSCHRTSDQVGVHHKTVSCSRAQLGIEVMVDTYLAARASCFIGIGASNVSCFVRYLKNWNKGEYRLLVSSMHHIRAPALYS